MPVWEGGRHRVSVSTDRQGLFGAAASINPSMTFLAGNIVLLTLDSGCLIVGPKSWEKITTYGIEVELSRQYPEQLAP
jgi:hypothetical protein